MAATNLNEGNPNVPGTNEYESPNTYTYLISSQWKLCLGREVERETRHRSKKKILRNIPIASRLSGLEMIPT